MMRVGVTAGAGVRVGAGVCVCTPTRGVNARAVAVLQTVHVANVAGAGVQGTEFSPSVCFA